MEFPGDDDDNNSDEDYDFTDLRAGAHSQGDYIDSDVNYDAKEAPYP